MAAPPPLPASDTETSSGEGIFSTLPEDLIHYVFSIMDAKSATLSSQVCRRWHSRGTQQELWKRHALRLCDFNTLIVLSPIYISQPSIPSLMTEIDLLQTEIDFASLPGIACTPSEKIMSDAVIAAYKAKETGSEGLRPFVRICSLPL